MTSSSSLGAVAEVREPVRGRNLSKVQIRHSDPDPSCDCYAPAPRKCECVSRAGRKRELCNTSNVRNVARNAEHPRGEKREARGRGKSARGSTSTAH